MIDPKNNKDRILMFIPGFLSWLMILMPIWLGISYPKIASFILTFVAIYWVYMSYTHSIGLYRGYKEYVKQCGTDWYKKIQNLDYKSLPNPQTLPSDITKLKHFILIPTVKETIEILEPTFVSIMDQAIPIENILVVIGTEEIGADTVKDSINQLQDKYKEKLPEIRQYIHPKGIPGEIVGVASPNRRWAASHAVEYLKEIGENPRDYIFTTFDSDTILHKEFLSRVTYLYLTDEKRFNRFYQTSIQLFDTNIWEVPVMSRIESNLVTFGLLSSWNRSFRFAETYSCYSCALDTVIAADYWDVRFIDDTVFYWRAYMAREGDFSAMYYYVPISSDATGGPDYITAHKNLFRQLVRWGWGSVGTVFAMKAIFSQKATKATLEYKLLWTYLKFERHLLQRTSAFLMTFGFTMITIVNREFKNSATVYGLPEILSIFLTGAILMFIPLTIVKRKIYPQPADTPFYMKVFHLIESPIVILNLLTYSFIPWLYAETMMMFGKLPTVTFYTPKTRK